MGRRDLQLVRCLWLAVIVGVPHHLTAGKADFERRPLEVAETGETGFRLVSPTRTGITLVNRLKGGLYLRHLVLHNGSGVAAGDVNGDGRCDLYFSRIQGSNRFYFNQGDWRFREASQEAGVACAEQYSTGAAFADIDGDRDLDLLVNSVDEGSRLFRNDGVGRFREVEDSGLAEKYGPTSMALADIEGDGDLDLYVTNFRRRFYQDEPANLDLTLARKGGEMVVTQVNGEPATRPRWKGRFTVKPNGEIVENGRPDFLYLNDGNGHFTRETLADGRFLKADGKPTPLLYDWGLAVMFRDLNGDGEPDLYICNDNNSPDRIWINDGEGRFRAIDALAIRHTSRSSMGVDITDVNRDGDPDILSLDMLARSHVKRHTQLHRDLPPPGRVGRFRNRPRLPRNILLLNRGDTTFAEIAHYSGLAASDWSWCPIFLDVDLDGYEDLLKSNGFSIDLLDSDHQTIIERRKRQKELGKRERQMLRRLLPAFETRNVAFRNRRDLTFEEVGQEWGFNRKGVSNGMALADLDNDGDMDAVVNNLNEKAGIYENRGDKPRIMVSLHGESSNTEGIGGKIKVLGGPVPQTQEVTAGGRYLSDDQTRGVFAAGNRASRLTIRVIWRSGRRSTIDSAVPNQHYMIHEPQAEESESRAASSSELRSQRERFGSQRRGAPPKNDIPYFRDVSDQLGHTHVETKFNDAARQPAIPRRLSQLGPGIAWYDLNEDNAKI